MANRFLGSDWSGFAKRIGAGLALIFSFAVFAAPVPVPKNALVLLPVLKAQQLKYWPSAPIPSFIAGQVETESCISLSHSKCWTPYAELKVKDKDGSIREWGLGLGQVTKTKAFDNFKVWRELHVDMAGFKDSSLYDPTLQLRGVVLYDRLLYNSLTKLKLDPYEHVAFTLEAYNAGLGRVWSDRKVCAATPGCDQNKWFGHVQHTSLLAKKAITGYGKSFYEINRTYVINNLTNRRLKYVPYME